jgi:hypothetical protein
MLSTRSFAVVAVMLGLLLGAALPAEASRRAERAKKTRTSSRKSAQPRPSKKKAATAKKQAPARRSPRRAATSSGDTSLRGRFEKIPAPKIAIGKIRLRIATGGGEGGGKLFQATKLKARGPAGPSFKQLVLKGTRKAARKQ